MQHSITKQSGTGIDYETHKGTTQGAETYLREANENETSQLFSKSTRIHTVNSIFPSQVKFFFKKGRFCFYHIIGCVIAKLLICGVDCMVFYTQVLAY